MQAAWVKLPDAMVLHYEHTQRKHSGYLHRIPNHNHICIDQPVPSVTTENGYSFFFVCCFNLFLTEGETECKQGRGRERGRQRIWNRLQALSYQHRAWRRAQTHKLWYHGLSRSQMLNQLRHPGTREDHYFQSLLVKFLSPPWEGCHNSKSWVYLTFITMYEHKAKEISRFSIFCLF